MIYFIGQNMKTILKQFVRRYSAEPQPQVKITKRAIIGFNVLAFSVTFYQYMNTFDKEKISFDQFIEKNQYELYKSSLNTGLDCIKHLEHKKITQNLFDSTKDVEVIHTNNLFSNHIFSSKIEQFILPNVCEVELVDDQLQTKSCSKPWKFLTKQINFYFPIGEMNKGDVNLYIMNVQLQSHKSSTLSLSADSEPSDLFITKISICDPNSIAGVIHYHFTFR
jgi:hypothetical protein